MKHVFVDKACHSHEGVLILQIFFKDFINMVYVVFLSLDAQWKVYVPPMFQALRERKSF